MANCSVCGQYSGVLSVHSECAEKLNAGVATDDIRSQMRRQQAVSDEVDFAGTANRVTLLSVFISIAVIVVSAFGCGALFASHDSDLFTLGLGFGAVGGGIAAVFFYQWVKMHALFMKKVTTLLEENRRL